MQHLALPFVDLYAGLEQRTIMRTLGGYDHGLVALAREQQPHVDATTGGTLERVQHLMIWGEVGVGDVHVFLRIDYRGGQSYIN